MGTRIFVGNLSYGSTEEGIGQHFDQFGVALKSARIIIDRDTGRSRGFAFVELADESQLEHAVRQLDGSMLEGRPLAVREAHDKPGPGGGSGPPRGGFGGPRPSFGGAPAIEARRPMGEAGPPRERFGPPADGDMRPPREPGRGFGGPPPDRGGFGGPPPDRGGFGAPRPSFGAGGPPPSGRNFGPPAGPAGKRKPKDRDREGDAGRGRGETEKRRRGFHGGRGYTEYEDDDE